MPILAAKSSSILCLLNHWETATGSEPSGQGDLPAAWLHYLPPNISQARNLKPGKTSTKDVEKTPYITRVSNLYTSLEDSLGFRADGPALESLGRHASGV